MLTRRSLLATVSVGAAFTGLGWPKSSESLAEGAPVSPGVPAGVIDSATLESLPGKKPLIRLAYRPPNYESPLDYLRTPITPNDEFFIRYHLSDIPDQIDPASYKMAIGGDGANGQTELTLDDLKKLDFTMVLPGHGKPFSDKSLIAAFQGYLTDVMNQVANLRRQGVSPEVAAQRVDLTSHQKDFPEITGPGAEPRGIRRIYEWMDERGIR